VVVLCVHCTVLGIMSSSRNISRAYLSGVSHLGGFQILLSDNYIYKIFEIALVCAFEIYNSKTDWCLFLMCISPSLVLFGISREFERFVNTSIEHQDDFKEVWVKMKCRNFDIN
jgi:hypothetical protein